MDVKLIIAHLPFVLAAVLYSHSPVAAQLEEDITQLHPSPGTIGIATGHSMPFNLAPAVATVITAEDLDSVGATTLSEALALVPGVNVLYRSQGNHFIFRGVRSDSNFNPDWLLMIDGIPQNDVGLGNQRLFIGEVPLQNIDRIEVIRGPGSSLYGTDAFAGVVNIITKRPTNVRNTEARLRVGSFDTQEGRYLLPGELGGIKSLFSLQLRHTDGFKPLVEADGQTAWDQRLGTRASLAPGRAQTWFQDYNLQWDLESGPWLFRLRRWAHELGIAGLSGSLDNTGWRKSDMNAVDLLYDKKGFASNWDLKWNTSWYDFNLDTFDVLAYPPGAFGGLFPQGVKDNPGYSEDRYISELSALYNGFRGHLVTIGLGAEKHRVYDVRETRNYVITSSGLPAPLPAMVSLDTTETFIPTASREIYFAYLQDEWVFAPDWTLTSGLRHDRYSDFGSTTNPRVALVWATAADLTTKFLIGRAFRAPTFTDLYSNNNPSLIGNPNLKPERITTYEISFDYRPTSKVTTILNVFHHVIVDKIAAVRGPRGTTEVNEGKQTANGGEIEVRWNVTRDLTVNGWYAHQKNIVEDTRTDAGFAPRNSANLRLDWRFAPNWYWNVNTLRVADRKRQAGDTRSPVGDYTFVNTGVRYKPQKSWSASLYVFNTFDQEARDPSNNSGFITDHALPPHSIFLEYRQEF